MWYGFHVYTYIAAPQEPAALVFVPERANILCVCALRGILRVVQVTTTAGVGVLASLAFPQ